MKLFKTDGWSNLLTGIGISNRDKLKNKKISGKSLLSRNDLTNLFVGEGLAKRIINVKVEDMTREGFRIEGDTDDLINKRLSELKARNNINSALRWSSLYGGSVIVLGLNDGKNLNEELQEDNIKNIDFMKVYDRYYTSVSQYYSDPEHPKFGEPELYQITPKQGGIIFEVHESRILRFEGSDIPQEIKNMFDGWGMSDLQGVTDRIRGLSTSYDNIERIIDEFILGTLRINNLQDLIAGGQEKLIRKRLDLIDMSRHILNTTLLDNEEGFERNSATVTGLDAILTKLELSLTGIIGIPITRFFGQSPKGLNATGESDVRQYYDSIGALQEERLKYPLERLIYLIMKEKEGYFKNKPLDNWKIIFNPLWKQTEKEISETRLQNARSDSIYLENGVLNPEEVSNSRFGGETYSNEINLGKERNIINRTIENGKID